MDEPALLRYKYLFLVLGFLVFRLKSYDAADIESELAKLAELKTLLKPRLVLELINLELDHRGRKADLLRRLKEHLVSHDATAPCTPAVLLKHTTQTTVHRSRPSQGESFTIVTISQQKQCED